MSQSSQSSQNSVISGTCEKCGEEYNNEYEWCKQCQINCLRENFTKWTSENEIIDDFIQETQLNVDDYYDVLFEWIPYNQFNDVKDISKSDFASIYSAIWEDGPLCFDNDENELIRDSNKKEVTLKILHDSQNNTDEFLNEVKTYSVKGHYNYDTLKIYGISQQPDTKDYIMVLDGGYCEEYCKECGEKNTDKWWCKPCQINYFMKEFANWTSEDKKIDDFIQEKQFSIDKHDDKIFEWIPYDRFNDVKEVSDDDLGDLVTMHSATWKDGPLYYEINDDEKRGWMRKSDERVNLKCLRNLKNNTEEFLNEVKAYLAIETDETEIYEISQNPDTKDIYGISQNPDTKDYVIVLKNEYCEKCDKRYIDTDQWCKSCQINYLKKNFANWTSENEKINDFIQEMQLRINSKADLIFEWIPYNKFNSVKEISKSDSTTIYSAIWNDGLSSYDNDKMELIRESDEKVTLKLLHDSQYKTNEFLNEVKTYSVKTYSVEGHANDDIPKIYGISQHPDTKDYIMVLQDGYCEKCGEQYKYIKDKWCKSCQINYFKKNFKSWTSGNENIDGLIQELQLKFDEYNHNIFEWISYDQFDNVTRLGGDAFVTIYSAIWNGGPLHYHEKRKEWIRNPGMKVALKCLHDSQNLATNELLDEINKYSISSYDSVLQIYGISQNPDTKDYTLVLQDGYCEACGKEYIDGWCKPCLMNYLKDDFTNWTSGNEKLDAFIQEKQLKVDYFRDKIFEWIPYDQFRNIKKIGQGGFATVYSAIWKDGPLSYNTYLKMWLNEVNTKVALKCLHDSKNVTDKFMKEIKAYSMDEDSHVLEVYGISQHPDTKDYIMVLAYAKGGNLQDWMKKNYKRLDWNDKLLVLADICKGLEGIHQRRMVHCDFHTGNILFKCETYSDSELNAFISDMGLCGEIGNMDNENVYGVMPYVASEVLRGEPYTQAADVYSFGMIMYFVATGRQPFADREHDEFLAIDICKESRPVIHEPEAPECYIDLIRRCWDPNPENRPKMTEIEETIFSFQESYYKNDHELNEQFREAEKHRKLHLDYFEEDNETISQAIYTSRLLNPYLTDCLDCEI